jgi:hypothetical protein
MEPSGSYELAARLNDRSLAFSHGSFAFAPTTGQAKGKYDRKNCDQKFPHNTPYLQSKVGIVMSSELLTSAKKQHFANKRVSCADIKASGPLPPTLSF